MYFLCFRSISASPSPSLPGRLTSPAPRMTSPQHHRIGGQQMQAGRILTSPSHSYGQQNIGQTQMIVNQHRFIRPQQQVIITHISNKSVNFSHKIYLYILMKIIYFN